jgi:hypothetical protein
MSLDNDDFCTHNEYCCSPYDCMCFCKAHNKSLYKCNLEYVISLWGNYQVKECVNNHLINKQLDKEFLEKLKFVDGKQILEYIKNLNILNESLNNEKQPELFIESIYEYAQYHEYDNY